MIFLLLKTLPMLLPPPSDDSQNLATVDSETLRMMPWIDFDVIMQNIDKNERERVIFDLLQANMPNIGKDIFITLTTIRQPMFSV